MATKYSKRSRKFLQPASSSCMAAVQWEVVVDEHWDPNSSKCVYIEGNLSINNEAKYHTVNRKAHLKPLYTMRTELNAFIDACEEALDVHNKANKSK